MTSLSEADEIRRAMSQIRLDLHKDVTGVVEEAEKALDWYSYFRTYPWLWIGASFAVGYLLVPRRGGTRRSTVTEAVSEGIRAARPVADMEPEPRQGSTLGSVAWAALRLIQPIAIRAVQSYALSWVEDALLAGDGRPGGGSSRSERSAKGSAGRPGEPAGTPPTSPEIWMPGTSPPYGRPPR